MLLVPRCDVWYDFRVKTMFDSCILTPICFVGGSVLFMSIVFIYVFWCLRFLYQMMFVSFNSSTTGATCGAETASPCEAHEFTPVCSGVRVSRFSVFCIMFCRSLFVLFLFGGSLYCLSYDLFIWLPLWYLQTYFLDFCFKFYSSSLIFSVFISLFFPCWPKVNWIDENLYNFWSALAEPNVSSV